MEFDTKDQVLYSFCFGEKKQCLIKIFYADIGNATNFWTTWIKAKHDDDNCIEETYWPFLKAITEPD